MPKRSNKPTARRSADVLHQPGSTLSAIRGDPDMSYKIQVLMYDLSHISSDPQSLMRVSATTHELYISEPYFTESEAIDVRGAMMDECTESHLADAENIDKKPGSIGTIKACTVEAAIHCQLANFFDKRKASGDARPCGPHGLLPIYVSVFGFKKVPMKDKNFLSRLKRSGLGEWQSEEQSAANSKGEKAKKKKSREDQQNKMDTKTKRS